MALIAVEKPEEYRIGVQGNKGSATRGFLVYDDAGINRRFGSLNAVNAVAAAITGPVVGENASGTGSGVTFGSVHPEDFLLFANDREVVPASGTHGEAWMVRWTYANIDPEEEPVPPDQVNFVDMTSSVDPLILNVWRDMESATIPADISNPSDLTDIGGEFVDSGGQPVSRAYSSQAISLRENIAFSKIGQKTAAVRSVINARNTDMFIGFEPNSLVYIGMTDLSRVEQGVYQATHSFVYDEFYHLRQRAQVDIVSAEAVLETNSPALAFGHAKLVYWEQPFKKTAAFASLDINTALIN